MGAPSHHFILPLLCGPGGRELERLPEVTWEVPGMVKTGVQVSCLLAPTPGQVPVCGPCFLVFFLNCNPSTKDLGAIACLFHSA